MAVIAKDAQKRRKKAAAKAAKLPSLGQVTHIRRVDPETETFEDFRGLRYAVWEVGGCDPDNAHTVAGWNFMLNALEFPVQFSVRQHAPDFTGVKRDLARQRPDWMLDGDINEVGNSLLDYLSSMERGEGAGSRVVDRRWYVSCQDNHSMEMNSLLGQTGFEAARLSAQGLSELLKSCCSGLGFGHNLELFQVREERNLLEMNQRYMATYEVFKWPRRISTAFIEGLLRSGDEMDLSLWLYPISQARSHSQLQMQRARFEGSRMALETKGKVVSPEVELAIQDASRIADAVERGISRLYHRTMMVSVYAKDRESLREIGQKVTSHCRSNLAGARPLTFRQGRGLAAMIPAGRRGTSNPDVTDSDTILRMFPFGPPDLCEGEGTLFAMDLRSRTPVIYDPFSPSSMNAHMVVMARSGAGKSFLTKLRVVREAMRGVPVYLIDPEGEYSTIAEKLGGEVFVPGTPGYGLNPFIVRYTGQGDLAQRVSSLSSLVNVMLEGKVDLDLKASIDRCLMDFYLGELDKFSEEERAGARLGSGGMAAFHDFLKTPGCRDVEGGQRLFHLLSLFSTGSARYLMEKDARDLVNDEASVTSFNLKNLTGTLKPVATAMCAEVVWGLGVSDPKPRLLVVDECWTMLATPSGAEALITIAKRARKYSLGLMSITQDVQDFLSEDKSGGVITGHAGRSLLQNSATKLALSQDPAALPMVVDALALSDSNGAFLAGALRGQGILVGEQGNTFPVEIVSTLEERQLVLDQSWRRHGDEEALWTRDEETGQLQSKDLGEVETDLTKIASTVEREVAMTRADAGPGVPPGSGHGPGRP